MQTYPTGLSGPAALAPGLAALTEGGASGVKMGVEIIPGVLLICTFVLLLTKGPGEAAVHTGAAYEGVAVLPWLGQKLSFILKPLFGFTSAEGIAVPITALGAAGAAIGWCPAFLLWPGHRTLPSSPHVHVLERLPVHPRGHDVQLSAPHRPCHPLSHHRRHVRRRLRPLVHALLSLFVTFQAADDTLPADDRNHSCHLWGSVATEQVQIPGWGSLPIGFVPFPREGARQGRRMRNGGKLQTGRQDR